MNLGKAREYFSAYYEGSLDRGLREGFERVIREDAQAQAEYRAFEGTMRQLEGLKALEVEAPDDLHERIMARIDRHAWEKNQGRKLTGFAWWKVLLPTAVAASVLTLAFVPWRTPGGLNTGGLIGNPGQVQPTAKMDVKGTARGVVLSYPSVEDREIVIRDGKGTILETLRLQNQGIRAKELKNEGAEAILLSIDESNQGTTWIAIPGSESAVKSVGKGTIQEMALEISAACHIPVIVQAKATEEGLQWKLDDTDAHGTASRAVEALGLKVELRGDRGDVRTLWILGN